MPVTQSNSIYMDANATLPMSDTVRSTILEVSHLQGNPSSIHGFGRTLRGKVEQARDTIANALNVKAPQVIFTSSGSEANNMVLNSFEDEDILTSELEHLSVLHAVPNSLKVKITGNGTLDLEDLENTIKNKAIKLVSIMYANNETGLVSPISSIIKIAKQYGCYVHTDAVQAFGKYELDFTELGLDYMSISAHKIGGPQGIGALIVAPEAPVKNLMHGGGQERRRRAGTENVLGICGFAAAIETARQTDWDHVRELRDLLEGEISKISADALIIDQNLDRLPNTSCLKMSGVESQKQLMGFDINGIAISAGSACSSGKVDQSHVLKAMGVTSNDTVRVSLCPLNTRDHVMKFVEVWENLNNSLRSSSDT